MKKQSNSSATAAPSTISSDDLVARLSKDVAKAIVETAQQMDGRRPMILTSKEAIEAYRAIASVHQAFRLGNYDWQRAKLAPHLQACKETAIRNINKKGGLSKAMQCLQMAQRIEEILEAISTPNKVRDIMLKAFRRLGVD